MLHALLLLYYSFPSYRDILQWILSISWNMKSQHHILINEILDQLILLITLNRAHQGSLPFNSSKFVQFPGLAYVAKVNSPLNKLELIELLLAVSLVFEDG